MPTLSKEDRILKLILENSPFKRWHFEELKQAAGVSRAVANKWMKKYMQEGLLKKIKENKRFPYFTAGSNNPVYYARKRIYVLEQLHTCGLFARLLSLEHAKTIILFGSMARGDWYKDSDIDLFMYGKADDFDKTVYEQTLGRHIELHIFESKEDLQEVRTGLVKNIINGYLIKGQIQDIVEVA